MTGSESKLNHDPLPRSPPTFRRMATILSTPILDSAERLQFAKQLDCKPFLTTMSSLDLERLNISRWATLFHLSWHSRSRESCRSCSRAILTEAALREET